MPVSLSNSTRILLLDDDALARAGLKMLLESNPGLKVTAASGEEEEALKLAEQGQIDIILLHENSSHAIGLELLPKLMAANSHSRIILITSMNDPQYQVRAVKSGVMGIVMAQHSPQVLFKAIEKVHAGEVWLDRSLIANYLVQETSPTVPSSKINAQARKIALLSAREREVVTLVGEGLKNQQIADQLFLSEVTVRHHLTSIFKKLEVSDRLELVIYAYQNSLAKLPD